MKKLKKLVLKKEVIASLSNLEMGMVVGGDSPETVYEANCPYPPDGTYVATSYVPGPTCPDLPFPKFTEGNCPPNTSPPRCCEYGCCETIGC